MVILPALYNVVGLASKRCIISGDFRQIPPIIETKQKGIFEEIGKDIFEYSGGESLRWRGIQDESAIFRTAKLNRVLHRVNRNFELQKYGRMWWDNLERLIDYCCQHYYPEITDESTAGRALSLFSRITAESARLCAQWMVAGFVHGVLNTDNLNITGESFDYGPYRFLPIYEPGFTAAYFDETGLYAYGRQPEAVHWNLCRLAECLLGLVDRDALAVGRHHRRGADAVDVLVPLGLGHAVGTAARHSSGSIEDMDVGTSVRNSNGLARASTASRSRAAWASPSALSWASSASKESSRPWSSS